MFIVETPYLFIDEEPRLPTPYMFIVETPYLFIDEEPRLSTPYMFIDEEPRLPTPYMFIDYTGPTPPYDGSVFSENEPPPPYETQILDQFRDASYLSHYWERDENGEIDDDILYGPDEDTLWSYVYIGAPSDWPHRRFRWFAFQESLNALDNDNEAEPFD